MRKLAWAVFIGVVAVALGVGGVHGQAQLQGCLLYTSPSPRDS